MGEIEHEAGEIGGEDFRPGGGLERSGLRRVPQPVADAGLGAPGAAAPLIGGGARDPHGLEPGQADVGLVARHPRQPAVDHHPHALDGERGFGDRGRQHDLAPARRRRRDGAVLRRRVERAVKRHDVDRRIGDALAQLGLGAADLGRARQERQHRSGLGADRLHDGVDHLPLDRRARIASEITGLDRKGAAAAFDHRRVAEQPGDGGAVEGRRHHQEAQVLAQPGLHVAGERQTEIGIERAFVELVEQQCRHALEARILEHPAGEHTLGDHLDAGRARDLGAEAHPVADGLADLLRRASRPCGWRRRGRRAAAAPAR